MSLYKEQYEVNGEIIDDFKNKYVMLFDKLLNEPDTNKLSEIRAKMEVLKEIIEACGVSNISLKVELE
jgi:hypothetical protein